MCKAWFKPFQLVKICTNWPSIGKFIVSDSSKLKIAYNEKVYSRYDFFVGDHIKLKDITVEASPRGNWVVFEHGKVIMTVNHDMLDEETIRTYNLEHHNS